MNSARFGPTRRNAKVCSCCGGALEVDVQPAKRASVARARVLNMGPGFRWGPMKEAAQSYQLTQPRGMIASQPAKLSNQPPSHTAPHFMLRPTRSGRTVPCKVGKTIPE